MDWTEVRRRRQTRIIHNETNCTTTFFVAGFQDETTKPELWKLFGSHGTVADVYMGGKKDARRMNFAFFRFKAVEDEQVLERRLQGMKCHGKILKVNISKHPRKTQGTQYRNRPRSNATQSHVPKN